MNLLPIPAFSDNYIWLLHDGRHALVVDPGDAAPVLTALQTHNLQLQAILLTHHHQDHVGGVAALRAATAAEVYGPANETLPEPVVRVSGHSSAAVHVLGLPWRVLDVPGHTAGHIAWWTDALPGDSPVLFCGDTLFSGGCGRLFEGTPAQMHASLQSLAALPQNTRVFCAHEYTMSNLRFALAVEPDNPDLQQYERWCQQQRQHGLPTLPSTIAQELAVNPFLRCHVAVVARAAQSYVPELSPSDPTAVLAALRAWKNVF